MTQWATPFFLLKNSRMLIKKYLNSYFIYLCHNLFKTATSMRAIIISLLSIFTLQLFASHLVFDNSANTTALEDKIIYAIEKDSTGFLWLASGYNLTRYDGYDLKTITLENNNFVRINTLELDNHNQLWAGSGNGLFSIDLETYQTTHHNSLFNEKEVRVRYISYNKKSNELWIGSMKGLYILNLKTKDVQHYEHQKNEARSIRHNIVRAIYCDRLENNWIGTYDGLCIFDKSSKSFEYVKLSEQRINEPKNELVLAINRHPYFKNKILVGSTKGLYEVDIINKTIKKLNNNTSNTLSNTNIKVIGEPIGHMIPLGTDCGLNLYAPESDTYGTYLFDPRHDKSIANNVIWSIYKDENNTFWFGTDNGLSSTNIHRNEFVFNRLNDIELELTDYHISSIFESKNELILGTNNGITKIDKGTQRVSQVRSIAGNSASISNDKIQDIHIDKDGILWVATNEGLNYKLPHEKRFHVLVQGKGKLNLKSNNIDIIEESSDGSIWVATYYGGVSRIVKSKNSPYQVSEVQHIAINTLNYSSKFVFIDHKDRVWIDTYNMGLFMKKYDNAKEINAVHFSKKEVQGNITSAISYNDGVLFATKKDLQYYLNNKLSFIDLPDNINNIDNLICDRQNNIWFTSSKQIHKLTLTDDSYDIESFNLKHISEFGHFVSGSIMIDSKGYLLVGTMNGLISFLPSQVKTINARSNVQITDIQINGKSIEPHTPINGKVRIEKQIHLCQELPLYADDRHLKISFSSLKYPELQAYSYTYKLENFDKQWHTVGSEVNSVTYSNLKAGKYLFTVRSFDDSGKNMLSEKSITFNMSPPWYASSVAIISYILFIILTIIIGIKVLIDEREIKHIKSLNKSKLQFFTNISHEFKTPLTLLLLPLQNTKDEDFDSPEKMKDIFSNVQRNADHLRKLISELMDFRKIEQGKLQLHVKEDNIIAFTKHIFDSFETQFKGKNIYASFVSRQDEYPLYFDHNKLNSVITNLLSNAVKFTPKGGEISLTIKDEDGKVTIVVEDSGVGISKKQQKLIFERFHQSHNKVINEQGTGIGLSLVKDYIELHSGLIFLESTTGEGAKFTITLHQGKRHFPENTKFVSTANIDSSSKHQSPSTIPNESIQEKLNISGKKEILIVEDELEIRSYLASALKNDFKVYEASNGLEAIKLLEAYNISLILSDQMMPEMDGLELLKHIRNDVKHSDIPFIFLTAKTEVEDSIKGVSTGADAYITKPFELEFIQAKVKSLLKIRDELKQKYSNSFLSEKEGEEISSADETFLKKVIEIIENNISNTDFSVDRLSQEFGNSNKTIYRRIKQLTELSPVELIKSIRLEKSLKYFEKGGYNISEVAYECGFSTPHYFSKCFKLKYGKSPRQYLDTKGKKK